MQCSAYQLLRIFVSSEATTPTSHSISSSFSWDRALRRVAGIGDARLAQAEDTSGEELDLSTHGPQLKPHLGVVKLLIVLERGNADLEGDVE